MILPLGNIKVKTISNDWLGREGSNLRMSVPKTDALPLGDAPTLCGYLAKRAGACKSLSRKKQGAGSGLEFCMACGAQGLALTGENAD